MKKLFVFILMLFIPFAVYAEELKMNWQKSWGGNGWDSFSSILETRNGSFILVGESYSTDIEGLPNKGYYDAIILKYDKDGNMLWQKSWGGNGNDKFLNSIETEDGSIILFGHSSSTDIEGLPNKGSDDIIIIKYDKDGNMLWQKSWGGNNNESFSRVIETEDGSIILAGYSFSTDIEGLPNKGSQDAIILKYDKNGNMLWQKSWGGNYSDNFSNTMETEDGSIILAGYSYSTDIEGLLNKGESDAIIVKYDKNGNLMWQKSWGGNGNDNLNNVIETVDESFILVGYTYSTDIERLPNKGSADAIILKYDKDGNMLWQKSWGADGYDRFQKIFQTHDDSFITSGYSESAEIEGLSNKSYRDAIMVKYDKYGNILWQKCFPNDSIGTDFNILLKKDNSIIASTSGFVTTSKYDVVIVEYDKDGNMLWQKSWGGNGIESSENVIGTEEGSIILLGHSYSTDIEGMTNKGSHDIILVKYSIEYDLGNVETENGSAELKQEGKYGIITPTPNEGYEVDKIIVKDKSGNVLDVEVTKQEDGTYSFELYTDVSVEVLFKEKLLNPKTGIVSYIGEILAILFISISTFCVLVFNKKSYRL